MFSLSKFLSTGPLNSVPCLWISSCHCSCCFKKFIDLAAWHRVFNLCCSIWDLAPWAGIKPSLPALGAQNLCHWAILVFVVFGVEFDLCLLLQYPYCCSSGFKLLSSEASLMDQLVKNLPAMQETWVQFLCWGDPLEKGNKCQNFFFNNGQSEQKKDSVS